MKELKIARSFPKPTVLPNVTVEDVLDPNPENAVICSVLEVVLVQNHPIAW